jgi:Domain of unknown function (DUF4386)
LVAANQDNDGGKKLEKNIDSNKKTARIAGALFIIATAASILSIPFLAPINASNYLANVSANENQVITGILLTLISAFASASIAISLYPVLKKHSQSLALGAVGFRLIEAIFYIVGIIGIVLLLSLSQEFVRAGAPNASYFQTLSVILLSGYHWVGNVAGTLAFYLAAMMYYCIFYRSKLIPKWLSGWGLVAVSLGIVASMLVMFQVVGSMSTVQVVLNLPIAVQEMVLAAWLIVKGFNSSAITSGAKREELTEKSDD